MLQTLFDTLKPKTPAAIVQRVMLLLLLTAVVVLLIANPFFRQPENLLNVVQQASMVGIVACGMQFMIISGGFDLSVGATAAAGGCIAAAVSIQFGIGPGIVAGALLGLTVGSINGILISKIDINPFVATFGMQAVVLGVMFALTKARPIAQLPAEWRQLGFFNISGLTFSSMVFIFVILASYLILRYTKFGQHVYAVGSNKTAAQRSGVKVDTVVIVTYALGGLGAAIAGMLLTSISGIGSPQAGTTWALLSIAAVVIGGTPLTGGVGGVSSAVIGIFALTILNNAMTLYSLEAFWQPAVMGAAVLITVGYESRQRQRRSA